MSWKPPTPPEWVQSTCLWSQAPVICPPRSVPQGQWPWSTFSLTSALIVHLSFPNLLELIGQG